jgi:hypothetical protein
MTKRFASDTFTSVTSRPFEVDGVQAGLALSLGHNILFFTTDPELSTLDGVTFADEGQLSRRIRRMRALRQPAVRAIA